MKDSMKIAVPVLITGIAAYTAGGMVQYNRTKKALPKICNEMGNVFGKAVIRSGLIRNVEDEVKLVEILEETLTGLEAL